ncbi:hypothetical protein C6V80_09940 (plasmid) [Caminibacter pacificus]|nr:hypothetical protein [Caminibacter pacificus]QDD68165.1 hypothetical protein C6V80_09940 [Caminibacter pacificus]
MKINKNELDKFISSLKNEIDIEEVKKENEIIKEEKLRDFYQKHINKVESFIKELEKKSAEIANKMLQYDESSKEYEELAKELTHNDSVLVSFSNAYYNNEVFRLNAKNLELFEKYVISGEL